MNNRITWNDECQYGNVVIDDEMISFAHGTYLIEMVDDRENGRENNTLFLEKRIRGLRSKFIFE